MRWEQKLYIVTTLSQITKFSSKVVSSRCVQVGRSPDIRFGLARSPTKLLLLTPVPINSANDICELKNWKEQVII